MIQDIVVGRLGLKVEAEAQGREEEWEEWEMSKQKPRTVESAYRDIIFCKLISKNLFKGV